MTKSRKNMKRRSGKTIKSKHKRGGAVLGHGAFGCVISPALPCPDVPVSLMRDTVSKLGSFSQMGRDLEILTKLSSIDPTGKYFPKMMGHCEINRALFSRQNQIDYNKCTRTMREMREAVMRRREAQEKKARQLLPRKDRLPSPEPAPPLADKPANYNIILADAGASIQNIMFSRGLSRKEQGDRAEIVKLNIVPKLNRHLKNLVEGLQLLHRTNIIHNDIKLDNMALGADMRFRILDFGVAREIDDIETKTDIMDFTSYIREGTITYLPPEVFIILELLNKKHTLPASLKKLIETYYLSHYHTIKPNLTEKILIAWIKKTVNIQKTDTVANRYIKNFQFVDYMNVLIRLYPKLDKIYRTRISSKIRWLEQKHKTLKSRPTIGDFDLVDDIAKDFLYNNYGKKDIYALGLSFKYIYNSISRRRNVGKIVKRPALFNLYKKMISPYFWVRPNASECLLHRYFS